jgi:hypothetical protein
MPKILSTLLPSMLIPIKRLFIPVARATPAVSMAIMNNALFINELVFNANGYSKIANYNNNHMNAFMLLAVLYKRYQG